MRTTVLFAFCFGLLLVGTAQAADSLNVRLVGSCHAPDAAYGVAVRDSYAFVADFSAGLRVISIADPANPTEVGHADVPDSAVAVTVSGNYAYVVGMGAGLRVISIADPIHPTEVGHYDLPGFTIDAAVNGNYAYVTDMDSGLYVISISDPAHPTEVGHCQIPGMAFRSAPYGHFVCVTNPYNGLHVVSAADPANPHEVGNNESLGFGGLAINGAYTYVGLLSAGLYVLSLADSVHPAQVGWCGTHEPIGSVVVDNDCAYTIGGSWLEVFSVSDPAHPNAVGHYYGQSWNGDARSLATSGDYIYVATDSGLSVCQRYAAGVEEATGADSRISRCEPTAVRSVLFLAEAANLKPQAASLLDISGRKVMDLHPGANDVSVLAPGVYFVSEGTASSIHKVIVAK